MEVSKFMQKVEKEPIKVNKWNHQEVRVALDDLIVKYMNEVKGFKEDHSYTNWRIFWIFLFNAVAGVALLFEYLRGFQEAKLALALASIFYTLAYNGYTFYWTWIEEMAFYRGSAKEGGLTLWLISKLALPSSEYEMKVMQVLPGRKTKQINTFKTCVGKWITEDGFVDVQAVMGDLQNIRFTPK